MSTPSSSTRVSARIAAGIKRQIALGRLRPGEKLLSERAMAKRCCASRVSVREAYRSLAELGVVTVRRGAEGGAYIAVPGPGAITESLALMLRLDRTSSAEISDAWLIQSAVAQLAARHAQPGDLARLRRVLAREEAVLSRRGRVPRFSTFHSAVARCARNRPLVTLVDCLGGMTPPACLDGERLHPMRTHRAHRAIVDAIERRDEESAYRLMRAHVAWVSRSRAGSDDPPRSGDAAAPEEGAAA